MSFQHFCFKTVCRKQRGFVLKKDKRETDRQAEGLQMESFRKNHFGSLHLTLLDHFLTYNAFYNDTIFFLRKV